MSDKPKWTTERDGWTILLEIMVVTLAMAVFYLLPDAFP